LIGHGFGLGADIAFAYGVLRHAFNLDDLSFAHVNMEPAPACTQGARRLHYLCFNLLHFSLLNKIRLCEKTLHCPQMVCTHRVKLNMGSTTSFPCVAAVSSFSARGFHAVWARMQVVKNVPKSPAGMPSFLMHMGPTMLPSMLSTLTDAP
jgi:hypothetical protein